ncbi:hypothetical protein WJX77_011648 [Trebouxia sp. C0004]
MLSFARQTWQQLDDHAAQGPDAYRKFHDKKMSLALGHARPDRLSDRKALLRIDTSILANASSVLVDTAQVCIRIYRSAPSLAASMAGSLTHGQCRFGKSSLMQQVLQYVQQKAGVKLATKSAKITVLSTETVISKDLSASGRHEDLSQIPAASSSHLPASLLSKLSLVKPEDKRTNKSSGVSLPTRVSATAAPSTQAKRRPLIQEM